MARKQFKKGKFGKRQGAESKKDGRGEWTPLSRENEKWETYYKALGLIPEEEWASFKEHCQRDLPVTFRVTGSRAHAKEINQKFLDNHVSKLIDAEHEGVKLAPKNIEFYPDNLGWQLDVPKYVIRRNAEFSKTQRFLVLETTVGNISRQEAVSMIPPLLMDVQPHHAVLDMCAAPGSKTAQLVEALHMKDAETPATGFVMANDSDYKRSHMLVHQVKRLNSPNFVVVNHDAQLFPRIRLSDSEPYLKFDRILCDVPCSGDGTMRKNINVWKDFTVGDGLGLHPLQVNILTRGLQLLKEGGRLVYSTCSMSPIENEAVVAEALRKFANVSLVDVSQDLPGLKRRLGVSSWKVFSKDMVEREAGDESVHATAFPPSEDEAKRFHLDRCVRVYPHLQNTGGFFITVFEKKAQEAEQAVDSNKRAATGSEQEPEQKKAKTTSVVPQSRHKSPRTANEEPFVFLDPSNEQLQICWDFYQIDGKFPRDTALVRNATGEACRTIYFVKPAVARILRIENQKLKLIHAGIKLFTSQRNDNGNCPWRAQSESLPMLKQYVGPSRQLTTNTEMLKLLFTDAFPRMEKLKESGLDNEFTEKLTQMSQGCVFLTVKRDGDLEALFMTLWRGINNVNLMVSKEDTHELLMRLYDILTNATDDGKEKAYQMMVEAKKKATAEAEKEAASEETPEEVSGETPEEV
ncbi:hypothetical protein METBIDRAFT_45690 [Metschnikowia bicuspidata var. bicuspidata NRRL YB-4993]|uniref:SAM-dependent MTase RsmB/NOP-type domain-containing protein n=1 Tax=Metschnikowia bicuspidata var. bicuspidata NRRL YB-4993 TaxID=869754 RepID=A0A1A0H687_9ASCO|nr:hypothetical protein METBIDRAFT_45690 [Metschnikowia bicuspidata var. bicuspidata NRRL YB-4993]OBA19428.1 hypothetical protein METBIDRAFT_45690 [Metschnikowia bicuspidata var. bicuspidata NRRL YB-4993]